MKQRKCSGGFIEVSLVFTFGLTWSGAHADEARCTAPPFGDTQKNYVAGQAALKRAARDSNELTILRREWRDALVQSCRAKFDDDRAPFHELSVGDDLIDSQSVTELADTLMSLRTQEMERRQAAQREDPNTVWAIFQCMEITGRWELGRYPGVLINGRPPPDLWPSLAKCQGYVKRLPGVLFHPNTGRAEFARGMWYECLSHHVDNWQRPE